MVTLLTNWYIRTALQCGYATYIVWLNDYINDGYTANCNKLKSDDGVSSTSYNVS